MVMYPRIWKAVGFLTTFDHNFDQNGGESGRKYRNIWTICGGKSEKNGLKRAITSQKRGCLIKSTAPFLLDKLLFSGVRGGGGNGSLFEKSSAKTFLEKRFYGLVPLDFVCAFTDWVLWVRCRCVLPQGGWGPRPHPPSRNS